MTITISKLKLALAVLAVVLVAPATALATHVFDDVDDGAFYAEPVEWAADNGITTGKSPTQFAPLDSVTRGESVTFLKRYDDNIVQPALAELANTGVVASQETGTNDPVVVDSTAAVEVASVTIGGTETVDVALTAHVQVENGGSSQGRFTVTVRSGDCTGDIVGAGGIRTGETTSSFVNTTAGVTGFVADAAAESTYVLCIAKVFNGAADGTVYRRGLVATWS